MRIGLDLQSTRGPVSGIGAYAEGLAAALAGCGNGHTFVPMWYSGFQRWPAPAELARTQLALVAEGWRRRLDLIHSPGFAPPLWGRARRVLTLHDLSIWQRPELLPAGPSRLYWRDFVPFAARRAACVVVPSSFTAEAAQAELRIPASRLRQLSYPPRTFFQPAPPERQAALRQRFGLRRPFLLGVGAVEPRKDWPGVVRAYGMLAGAGGQDGACGHDLVLAGGVSVASSHDALEAAIQRLGPGARVRRLGYVAPEWLAPLYSAATAFVFPETHAGYGLPLLEAMACGTPVVSYANTALPETAGGAAVLIPPPYRPGDLAAALREVIDNPARRVEMRARGEARVRELDWGRTARAMVGIFEAVGA